MLLFHIVILRLFIIIHSCIHLCILSMNVSVCYDFKNDKFREIIQYFPCLQEAQFFLVSLYSFKLLKFWCPKNSIQLTHSRFLLLL